MKTIQQITNQFIADLTFIVKADAREQAMAAIGGSNGVKGSKKVASGGAPVTRSSYGHQGHEGEASQGSDPALPRARLRRKSRPGLRDGLRQAQGLAQGHDQEVP